MEIKNFYSDKMTAQRLTNITSPTKVKRTLDVPSYMALRKMATVLRNNVGPAEENLQKLAKILREDQLIALRKFVRESKKVLGTKERTPQSE